MITEKDIGRWVLFDNKNSKIIFKIRRITYDLEHNKSWIYGSAWMPGFEDEDYYYQKSIGYLERLCRILSQEELMFYQL